jgi:ADP-L-glycero-D-manno-heptose 6-epimerase
VWGLNRLGCTNIVMVESASREEREANLRSLRFRDYLDPHDAVVAMKSGALGKFDYVFHMGACSSTLETNEEYLRENNVEFSLRMAECALGNGARFVYASSAATYGDGSAGMDDRDPSQLDQLRPLNAYARSKQAVDLELRRRGWLDRVAGLKYFNVFGPNEGHKGPMRSVVVKSFEQVMQTGTIQLFRSYRTDFRSGEQRRDFLYVKDAVAMTLFLAGRPEAKGIFNIGSGEAHTWNELARAVFAALGREPRIEYIDMPAEIRDKYQYFTQAKIGKLRAAGYSTPTTPLSEAVTDYVVSYLAAGKSLGAE